MPLLSKAVGFGSLFLWLGLSSIAAAASDEIKSVVVSPLVKGERADIFRVTGSVFSRRYSKLSSEVEGLVSRVVPEIGAYVRAGDVICHIDETFAQLDLRDAAFRRERAAAALAEAKRQYDEGIRLSQEKIVAESDLATLKSNTRIAESELRRAEILETRSQALLDRFTIRAPFDGMVVSKGTEEGEWITRGGTAVTMVELDAVFVEFLVPQGFYHRLDRARPVEIQFEALPGRTFSGSLHGVVALASESSRTFPVRVELKNSDHAIAPGMSARGSFWTQASEEKNPVLVPSDAIVRTPDGSRSVWVVEVGEGEERIAVERSVELGSRQGSAFVVKSGLLAEGEQVIVRGNERLTNGERVKVVESVAGDFKE